MPQTEQRAFPGQHACKVTRKSLLKWAFEKWPFFALFSMLGKQAIPGQYPSAPKEAHLPPQEGVPVAPFDQDGETHVVPFLAGPDTSRSILSSLFQFLQNVFSFRATLRAY